MTHVELRHPTCNNPIPIAVVYLPPICLWTYQILATGEWWWRGIDDEGQDIGQLAPEQVAAWLFDRLPDRELRAVIHAIQGFQTVHTISA